MLRQLIVRESTGGVARIVALSIALLCVGATTCRAEDFWGGSVAATSDYLVRGISRTSDQAALQLDLHYANSSGFLVGVFASNTQMGPYAPRDVELSAFVGFGWTMGSAWQSKIMANHYAYPWNKQNSEYEYDELLLDTAYQGWLHLSLGYSPNTPLVWPKPVIAATEKSAEVSVQRQIWGKLSGTAGVGYSFLDGRDPAGYVYWSVGAAYDWHSLSMVFAYVNTSAEAKVLFPNTAASGLWTGTILWHF